MCGGGGVVFGFDPFSSVLLPLFSRELGTDIIGTCRMIEKDCNAFKLLTQ